MFAKVFVLKLVGSCIACAAPNLDFASTKTAVQLSQSFQREARFDFCQALQCQVSDEPFLTAYFCARFPGSCLLPGKSVHDVGTVS